MRKETFKKRFTDKGFVESLNPRIVMLPFMAIFELVLLIACVLISFLNKKWAIAINDWSSKFPDFKWYT